MLHLEIRQPLLRNPQRRAQTPSLHRLKFRRHQLRLDLFQPPLHCPLGVLCHLRRLPLSRQQRRQLPAPTFRKFKAACQIRRVAPRQVRLPLLRRRLAALRQCLELLSTLPRGCLLLLKLLRQGLVLCHRLLTPPPPLLTLTLCAGLVGT